MPVLAWRCCFRKSGPDLARACEDKERSAYLFTEDGETLWRRHMWARHMRAAIAKHNVDAKGKDRMPTDASAYSFRQARISELLQVYCNPLTIRTTPE